MGGEVLARMITVKITILGSTQMKDFYNDCIVIVIIIIIIIVNILDVN